MGDDTYLSVFLQPLSGAGDSMIICYQVAFGAANGLCTQSQTLLMEKKKKQVHMAVATPYLSFQMAIITFITQKGDYR